MTFRRWIYGIVLIGAFCTMAGTATAADIHWVAGQTTLQQLQGQPVEAQLERLAARPSAKHVVVQFDAPLSETRRTELEASGVTLLNYLGNNAYFARMTRTDVDAPRALAAGVSRVSEIQRSWKLHPYLEAGNVPSWAVVTPDSKRTGNDADLVVGAYVIFQRGVNLEEQAREVCLRHDAMIRSELESINGLVIELPFGNLKSLAEEDAVQWVEPPLPRLSECNNDNRVRTGANIVQAAPYGLDGSGVKVLVYDGGEVLASHADFGGRVTVRDSSGVSDHSTHVAGTVGGSGASSGGTYRGMAPGVTIESYGFEMEGGLVQGFLYTDPGDLQDDYSQAINTYGCDLSNNSIGTNTAPNGFPCDWEGNYGATGVLIDTIVRGDGSNPLFTQPFRVIWANGNERQGSATCGATYHTTAPPACAKNHITVGALNSNDDSVTDFTSWGPADDNRMKPDISAPGCQSNDDFGVTSCSSSGGYAEKCGTSMAAPTVTGLAALLLQDYRIQYAGEPDFRNSTLKCFFAHTAVDLFNAGPDYQTGYGSVRIEDAINLMRSGNWLEDTVSQGATYSALAIVGAGDGELKITLAWDDYPGTPNVNPVLVNDLDLRVYSPTGVRAYPWTLGGLANPSAPAVRTQENHVDNIEQVYVQNPAVGAWLIEIHGYNVPEGPQPFSLTVTPTIVACAPKGVLTLDATKFACEDALTATVVDCDLNTSDLVVDTVNVKIASTSETGGELVTLTETAAESAKFVGTVTLSQTDGAGVLFVGPGDAITATYIDADDGEGGVNVPVTANAIVDCTGPVISSVQATNIQPRSATITFTTDEPANGVVHYGIACGALVETATESGFKTAHTFNISGLDDNGTFFYSVEASDEAGNNASDDNGGSCYSFSTPEIPDYWTEEFGSGFDLDNLTLTFSPNGTFDFYEGCVEEITSLPTDPSGGTSITLDDDDNQLVTLTGGATVSLYGVSYGSFYISSNGYITFGVGDSDYDETLAEHFETPRVAAVYDDLNPSSAGTVSWKQLADRVAITWLNVPEFNTTNSNTLQIELFFDGDIVISYLDVASNDSIVGLSQGNGLPLEFYETDLSEMGNCGPKPPKAFAVGATTAVSIPVAITLNATDDGLPEPASLSYIVASLPANGSLADPGAGAIAATPYTLVGGGNEVLYTPTPGVSGPDSFSYMANDGGTSPEGGDSNTAQVSVTIGGPAWDPVAHDVTLDLPASTPSDVMLNGTDPNGDMLTYIIESLPAAGTGLLIDPNAPNAGPLEAGDLPYTLLDNGKIVRFLPPFGQTLSAAFTYSVSDATAGSNVADVDLTIGEDVQQLVYDYNMDVNPGWSVQGLWGYGTPTGGGTRNHDPAAGYTGTKVYGYNLYGDYTNSMLQTMYLTTTAQDCSLLTETELRFHRWLGIEAGSFDHAIIEISVDGANWYPVWEHTGAAIADAAWISQSFDISAWADGASTVYLRWGIGPTDDGVTYPGWNLDDIEIWAVVHNSCDGVIAGDANLDGLVNGKDIQRFTEIMMNPYDAAVVFHELCAADADGDGFMTYGDVDAFVTLLLQP